MKSKRLARFGRGLTGIVLALGGAGCSTAGQAYFNSLADTTAKTFVTSAAANAAEKKFGPQRGTNVNVYNGNGQPVQAPVKGKACLEDYCLATKITGLDSEGDLIYRNRSDAKYYLNDSLKFVAGYYNAKGHLYGVEIYNFSGEKLVENSVVLEENTGFVWFELGGSKPGRYRAKFTFDGECVGWKEFEIREPEQTNMVK